MPDGRGCAADRRRMRDGCAPASAAEARRQCDGRAMDGRPVRPSRVCLLASVVCPSRPPPSIRHKAEIRLISALRRMDGGCAADGRRMCRRSPVRRASAAPPSRVRRLSAAQPPSIRHKAEIKPYFGLMTDGRRARDGQTTLARRMCDRRATDALWSSVHRASVALPWRLRCAAAAHPSRNRRLSAAQTPSIRHKAEISLIRPYYDAGRRAPDGQTTLARG